MITFMNLCMSCFGIFSKNVLENSFKNFCRRSFRNSQHFGSSQEKIFQNTFINSVENFSSRLFKNLPGASLGVHQVFYSDYFGNILRIFSPILSAIYSDNHQKFFHGFFWKFLHEFVRKHSPEVLTNLKSIFRNFSIY